MILALEKWLEEQKISSEANSCFRESFVCYRAGAYKAALLFSYLGFMNVIHDRILASPCPAGVPAGQWTTIQANMRRAETWDKAAFDATQQQRPAPIFMVTDDLRRQITFWKDRRNDCAHSKDNKITPAYVEALHAFIESNLNKFAVNGSRTEMARRIQEYYDPGITPPSSNIEPIIYDIPHAVLQDEIPSFLADLSAEFDAARNPVEVMLGTVSVNKLHFLNAVFQHGTPILTAACIDFLLADDGLLLAFLRAHPDKVIILNGKPEKVRKLWHDYLFTGAENDFPVIASMLRGRLIPPEQNDECMRHLILIGTAAVPNEIDNSTMEEHGFYRQLEDFLVNTHQFSQFEWANKCKALVIKHIADHPLSEQLARAIYQNYDLGYHPWHMASHLNDLFRTNAAKRDEYIALSTAHPDIGRPGHIPSLGDAITREANE
ncbi:MAG: hypothetical protein KAV87_07380 [Desulfobacteraceae bacterium]|nr:hypothetical protein [Desulfobacteraceae bacterium]